MKRILMNATAAGPDGVLKAGEAYEVGERGQISEAMAAAFVAGHYAKWLDEAPAAAPVEVASAEPVAEVADAPAAAPEAPRRKPRK